MLKNSSSIRKIKSSIVLKKIFSLLWETKKLNLVFYNKELQNILFININDYKIMSNKYKIGDKNGLVKEYIKDTNIVAFGGVFKNGLKNGFGVEFYENKEIKFKGNYLNGKKICGHLFDKKGNETFFLEDGRGKEYYNNKNLMFKG